MNESKYIITRNYDLTLFATMIADSFSVTEMKTDLIFHFGLNKEISGTTQKELALELLTACNRRDLLPALLAECKKHREKKPWDDVVRDSEPKPPPPELLTKRNGWLVVSVLLLLAVALGIELGRLWGNGRNIDTDLLEATPAPIPIVNAPVTITMPVDLPMPANAKEQFDFETDSAESPTIGWSLKTCPNLDTTQCGWLNADDKLSLAQMGFSGENSLQVEAALVNVEQIYSTERCFDPAILDGISANVYVPAREDDGKTLAATKIYLLARPQGDNNAAQQWPVSVFELDKAMQPGWHQVFLDLSQVANERRKPYNTLLVDCLHIDLILPAVSKNEQVAFLIDDVTLYHDVSSHALDTNILPRGLTVEEINVTAPTGEGIIFDFEDGIIDTDIWSASDHQGPQPITISNELAYDGIYSLKFTPRLEEREDNHGGNTYCFKLNGDEVSLRNRIFISRLYIPEDAPYNLSVQYHLTAQTNYPSWSNYGDQFNLIKPGMWNTFAWYTADSQEWEEESDLQICLYLFDRDENEKNKYPQEGQEQAMFYLDSVEIIPYKFVYIGRNQKTLEPVKFYGFDSEDPPSIIVAGTNPVTPTSGITLTSGQSEIYALQLDVDLSPNPTNNRTDGSVVTMQLDPDEKPIEAVISMINFPSDPGGTLLVTIEGTLSNGNVISQTFPVSAGNWTPLFWPTRGNDFDAGGSTREMVELAIYLTSPDGYQGPVYFDYLALYRRFPEQ